MQELDDYLHDFKRSTRDVKTREELYEAIENFGPIPRCLTKHTSKGVVRDYEFVQKTVEAIYAHARQKAIQLRHSHSDYPLLPPPQADPFLGIQTVSEWCIEADLASTKPKETEQKIEPVEAPKQNAFRGRNAIRLKFTIWNKDDNYKLLLDIINDSTRDGIPVKNIRKLNTLKERLKKAGNTYKNEDYKKFANSLKYRKDGRIYTEMPTGMIIPEIKSQK